MQMNNHVKVIGANGQISLGKEFAGKMVSIDQINEGTWVIKVGQFIPDSEKWLHQGKDKAKLDKALEWAEKNEPKDNFNQLTRDIDNG